MISPHSRSRGGIWALSGALAVLALPGACVENLGRSEEPSPIVSVVVNSPEAVLCPEPKRSTDCSPIGPGESIDSGARLVHVSNEWTPITGFFSPGPLTRWIESKYLTPRDSLKKVRSSWPVRFLYFEQGDNVVYIDFQPVGSVTIKVTNLEGTDINLGHVFVAPGIMQVRTVAPSRSIVVYGGGYDSASNKMANPCEKFQGLFCVFGEFADERKPINDPWGECILDCDVK